MKNASKASRILKYLANNPGRHKTAEIAEAIGVSVNSTSPVLTELTHTGEITKIKKGIYTANDTGNPSICQQTLRKNISALREAEANEETINVLLNTYDLILLAYQSWILKNIDKVIDFEKQLLFIENLKWLTAIVDKLMKRWALVHVGYDTNSRQAQEDAKAKTQEREKAELENAPVADRVMVIGRYDPEAEALIDCIPSSLKKLSDEEKENITV